MNTETVRKELPEGWTKQQGRAWSREDGSAVWANRNKRYSAVPGGLSLHDTIRSLVEYDDPYEAIAALDREYPMEKQHGEK